MLLNDYDNNNDIKERTREEVRVYRGGRFRRRFVVVLLEIISELSTCVGGKQNPSEYVWHSEKVVQVCVEIGTFLLL